MSPPRNLHTAAVYVASRNFLFNFLLPGVLVLPLSAVYEVVDSWVFGRHLCFLWLSVDVWTCTASILHLVAISMDRYIAVTHPVTYPNIMTNTRYIVLIVS